MTLSNGEDSVKATSRIFLVGKRTCEDGSEMQYKMKLQDVLKATLNSNTVFELEVKEPLPPQPTTAVAEKSSTESACNLLEPGLAPHKQWRASAIIVKKGRV